MNYIFSYFTNTNMTNYSLLNETNIYNFLISTFDLLKEEDIPKFFENLNFIVGRTFVQNFRLYVFSKSPKHDILNYI